MPRAMAIPNPAQSCCCAAPMGPSRTNTGTAALRRTAEPTPQQPRERRRTPKQWAEYFGKLAEYEAGESEVHSARRLIAPPPPRPPNAAGSDGCAVSARRRRSPIQRAERRRSTRTVTDALAARLVVHYCTGRSKCRAHRARAAAAIGGAKRARARSAVPCTMKGGQARSARKRTCRATQCEFAFPPTQPTDLSLVSQAEQQRPAFDEVRPHRRARRSAE
jgi:hypothetical protein